MAKSADKDTRWLIGQVRAESRKTPQAIGEVISKLLTRRGYANVQLAEELADVWQRAAGPYAGRTRPAKLSRGILEIMAKDSVTLQELTFQSKQLLADVNRLAPQWKVSRLRFKVGEVK